MTEQQTSRYVKAGSTRVHYNEVGAGEPLVFCEGQGPGTSAWFVYHRVVKPLSRHFRCLLIDQPGYGKSDSIVVKDESRSTMYARTVREFLDAASIERATIVDMSFGAQTAQILAAEHPDRVRKLVLHASGMQGPSLFAYQPTEGITALSEAFKHPTLETMRKMMDVFLFEGTSYSDEDLMLKERLEAWLSRPEQDEARRKSDTVQRDLSRDMHRIKAPVLQIHGRQDRVSPLEGALRLFNSLPNSRIVILNRCGHWVPFEQPAEFARLVIDFVNNSNDDPAIRA